MGEYYSGSDSWLVGLSMDDTVWVPTVFTKNRGRLTEHDAVIAFFIEVATMAKENGWAVSSLKCNGC